MADQARAGRRLALFFTHGVSLRTWDELGSLERETALYRRLRAHLDGVTFITYGGPEEADYAGRLPGIDICCNQQRLPLDEYAAAIPDLHRPAFQGAPILKTNQMPGAEVAVAVAERYRLPLVARCGYLWSLNAAREHGECSSQAEQARAVERRAFTRAARCVVTTETLRRHVCAAYDLPAERVSVVPNYVLTDQFRPMPAAPPVPGRIVFVGRGGPEKNLPALLEALQGLPVQLILIGGAAHYPDLRARAAALNLDVVFRGNRPHAELPLELNQAEVFVLPSLWEGHPKALLEAMACGRPVVATDVPGIRDVVTHLETGYLCGTSADSLRAAVQTVLADKALQARLGARAREYVHARFGLEQVLRQELSVLSAAGGWRDPGQVADV